MLNKEQKTKIIKTFAKTEADTGSAEVQIALLSKRISELSEHLKHFPKDTHSKLGLIKMVSKRKDLLNYLKNNDLKGYEQLAKKLKIEEESLK